MPPPRPATPEEMIALGHRAGASLSGPAVFALVGGLGGGKTHWTKGLVAGLDCPAEVTSPTFGLIHEYRGGRLPIFHLDFYRLESETALLALGWDEILDEPAVVVAEWADRFPALLPPNAVWLSFQVEPDGARTVTRCGCGTAPGTEKA